MRKALAVLGKDNVDQTLCFTVLIQSEYGKYVPVELSGGAYFQEHSGTSGFDFTYILNQLGIDVHGFSLVHGKLPKCDLYFRKRDHGSLLVSAEEAHSYYVQEIELPDEPVEVCCFYIEFCWHTDGYIHVNFSMGGSDMGVLLSYVRNADDSEIDATVDAAMERDNTFRILFGPWAPCAHALCWELPDEHDADYEKNVVRRVLVEHVVMI